MTSYLVTFKPLEPFAFGAERNFQFSGRVGAKAHDYYPYFIRTSPIPEQTTILGTLRFAVLQSNKVLKPISQYTDAERQAMSDLIGPQSFSFQETEQDFGLIKRVSPLFLLKYVKDEHGVEKEPEKIIPNPFNNTGGDGNFSPMQLEEEVVQTNFGNINLPIQDDYNAKEGHASGYYNLTLNKKEDDPFKSAILSGNNLKVEENGFFKREVYSLNDAFCFAVYVEADKLPNTALVSMGQKQSLFQMTATEKAENLVETVRSTLAPATPKHLTWYYALSDVFLGKHTLAYDVNHFSIVEKKSVRNLETDYTQKTFTKSIRRSEKQYNLIQRGSVFYNQAPQPTHEASKKIGYNTIVEIKGEK